jgi:hypothetical protein
VVFVLKETEPEAWINNGGDFYAYLKAPSVEDVVSKVSLLVELYTLANVQIVLHCLSDRTAKEFQ